MIVGGLYWLNWRHACKSTSYTCDQQTQSVRGRTRYFYGLLVCGIGGDGVSPNRTCDWRHHWHCIFDALHDGPATGLDFVPDQFAFLLVRLVQAWQSVHAVFVEWLPHWIEFGNIDPVFAAVLAGLLAGTGILMLIRHGASLGGVTITAIYLQKERGWSAGKVQMAVDAAILLVAFNVVDLHKVLLSLLGAAALNFVIGVNHRHGRYFGV